MAEDSTRQGNLVTACLMMMMMMTHYADLPKTQSLRTSKMDYIILPLPICIKSNV